MKRCFFIIYLLLNSIFMFAEGFNELIFPKKIDILSSFNLTIPLNEEKNPHFNFDTGLRMQGKQYSLLASLHSQKLFFNNEEDFFFEKLTFCYAGQIFLSDKLLPFNLQTLLGTLQYSSALSRLKNPILKQTNALSQSFFLSPGIAPKLPSLSYSAKMPSICLSISAGKKTHFLPTVQLALTRDLDFYYSVYKAFYTPIIPSFTLGFTGSLCSWQKSSGSGWFLKRRAVPKNFYTSQEALCSLNFKFFKSSSSLLIFENPFSTADFAFETKNSLNFSHFCLQSAVFASGKGFYTANGASPDAFFQARINPQTKWKLGNQKKAPTLKAGILCGIDFCFQNEIASEEYKNALLQTDLSLDTLHFRFCVSAQTKQNENFSKAVYNAKAQINYYGKTIKCFSTFSFQEDKTASICKESASMRFAVYPLNGILYSAQIKSNFSFKDSELDSSEISSSVTFKFSLKQVNVNAKLALQIPIF